MTTKGEDIQQDKENDVYVLEKVEVSEESEPESLEIESIEETKEDEEDFNTLEKLLQATQKKIGDMSMIREETKIDSLGAKTVQRLEVVDDFFRNFLIKHSLAKTLEIFQQEWYEMQSKGKLEKDNLGQVPDVYIKNEKLQEQIDYLKSELEKAQIVAEKAKSTWDKLRKERDFHKMHHNRVQQEKKKLHKDIDSLKALHKLYETKYQELTSKYEAAMKEKMLLKLERDRLYTKSDALQKSLQNIEEKMGGKENSEDKQFAKLKEKENQIKQATIEKSTKKVALTPIPSEDRVNPFAGVNLEPINYKNAAFGKTFKGHMMAISRLAMHPKKSIVATASDDYCWKIWALPNGEPIMSGEGHKDWVSGVDFHPRGTHLATSSGDCTIKVWDFIHASCMVTFKEHIQPVWAVSFNDTGDFLLSASMDHTCRLLDLNAQKHRYTFRGHVDSVNMCAFKPYSNIFASASADKTISLWDIKSGLCVQTFYGHLNCVNYAAFNNKGDSIASCDSDGIVKIWDIRMIKEKIQFDAGPYASNSVSYCKAGVTLAVGTDEGMIKLYSESTGKLEHLLKGHEDAVQDVKFDYNSKQIVSASSDCSFKTWQ